MAASNWIRKTLGDIAHKHNEAVFRKVIDTANEPWKKSLRDLSRNVSEIQEKSTHIFDNPSLWQEAILVDQAKQQLDETVDNLIHQYKILRDPVSTPGLTTTMMILACSLIGIDQYLRWKK